MKTEKKFPIKKQGNILLNALLKDGRKYQWVIAQHSIIKTVANVGSLNIRSKFNYKNMDAYKRDLRLKLINLIVAIEEATDKEEIVEQAKDDLSTAINVKIKREEELSEFLGKKSGSFQVSLNGKQMRMTVDNHSVKLDKIAVTDLGEWKRPEPNLP